MSGCAVCAVCDDPDVLATLHHAVFAQAGWPAGAFSAQLALPGGVALCIAESAAHPPTGLALLRVLAGEGEILTFGVAPAARRRGLGRALLDAVIAETHARGGATLFLEVAEDNAPARALYAAAGFAATGRRAGYYARAGGPAIDALILSRAI